MAFSFLREVVVAVWRRRRVWVVLNWLFFGFIDVGSLLVGAGVVQVFAWPFGEVIPLDRSNVLLVFGVIFVFNLVVSGFLPVTLSGLVFFGLPLFFLCFRGFLWGTLLYGLSTPTFLAALPTMALEGEGYVLAALAGVNLGLSWLKPNWIFRGENLSRSEAVRRALKEGVYIYFWAALFLLAAAVVETATLVYM